jgi:hypothetical protein
MAHVVEYLPYKCKALSSNPSTAKEKEREREDRRKKIERKETLHLDHFLKPMLLGSDRYTMNILNTIKFTHFTTVI